jgi:hypothetical protein
MFRRLRIAVLLYVLVFVAAAQFFAARRSTNWDNTLWVNIYPVAAGNTQATRAHVDSLSGAEFKDVETFFIEEARLRGLPLDTPFKLNVAKIASAPPPRLERNPSALDALVWSLRMRWLAARLEWSNPAPAADIVAFAVFHDDTAAALDQSRALEKGLIVVANLFAAKIARDQNQVVLAHELLHTLGARDKYDPHTNQPLYPEGYADPDARPRFPQMRAELMAGRIPLRETEAAMPANLRSVVIGDATAREIGWPQRRL